MSNDQELAQSEPNSCPRNKKLHGNTTITGTDLHLSYSYEGGYMGLIFK